MNKIGTHPIFSNLSQASHEAAKKIGCVPILLLFVKAPVRGRVKTRLAKKVGDKNAVELYKCFVEDLLELLKVHRLDFRICLWPPDAAEDIRNWLGVDCWPQEGDDLGRRMSNAFERAFSSGAKKVVLIGSDVPDMPIEHILEGFEALDHCDVVLGPCHDGGYYLIGLSRQVPEAIFEHVDWGTKDVYSQTVSKIKHLGLAFHELAVWFDVDTFEDLMQLRQRQKDGSTSKTAEMIRASCWFEE